MQSRLESQATARVKEVEEQKQTEYTMAMMNVRQGIKKLEAQVESEKRQQMDLESTLAEERNNLSRHVFTLPLLSYHPWPSPASHSHSPALT